MQTHLPGKFVWFELVGPNVDKARPFYGALLGWRTAPFAVADTSYDMIFAGATPDTMLGGYVRSPDDGRGARWVAAVSVDDVDEAARAAAAHGGKVLQPPHALPGIGRAARIADPAGAELTLFHGGRGDPPDASDVPAGRFFWNELHTPDPPAALAFYEEVVGFSHQTFEMGAAGAYHVVSSGGVDRGGVTSHLPAGAPAHWLPYVLVADVDAKAARASELGGRIAVPPADIPGIGRFAVIVDPAGALFAVMKPTPPATRTRAEAASGMD